MSGRVVPSEVEVLDSVVLGVLSEVELSSVVLEGSSGGAVSELLCTVLVLSVVVLWVVVFVVVVLSVVPELLQSTLDGQSQTSNSGLK